MPVCLIVWTVGWAIFIELKTRTFSSKKIWIKIKLELMVVFFCLKKVYWFRLDSSEVEEFSVHCSVLKTLWSTLKFKMSHIYYMFRCTVVLKMFYIEILKLIELIELPSFTLNFTYFDWLVFHQWMTCSIFYRTVGCKPCQYMIN